MICMITEKSDSGWGHRRWLESQLPSSASPRLGLIYKIGFDIGKDKITCIVVPGGRGWVRCRALLGWGLRCTAWGLQAASEWVSASIEGPHGAQWAAAGSTASLGKAALHSGGRALAAVGGGRG